jgi:hypothetical protein
MIADAAVKTGARVAIGAWFPQDVEAQAIHALTLNRKRRSGRASTKLSRHVPPGKALDLRQAF